MLTFDPRSHCLAGGRVIHNTLTLSEASIEIEAVGTGVDVFVCGLCV